MSDEALDPHRIRLRGPWEVLREGGVWERFHFPGRLAEIGEPRARRAIVRRGFSRPANLDDEERVWLVCEGLPQGAVVWLNGEDLRDGVERWDITERLLLRNVVEMEVTLGAAEEKIVPGEVRLEIVSSR